jgi:hypothetical protein
MTRKETFIADSDPLDQRVQIPRYIILRRMPPTPATDPSPKAFISYYQETAQHRAWVLDLATRLHGEDGVQVTLDQWHLQPGEDRLRFMEQGIQDSDFVIIVCTPKYAERANDREGGVGYESTVITALLAEKIATNKFIPVLREGDWKSALPTYCKSRYGVDLRNDPYQDQEYEALIRTLHGEPLRPPPLGPKPTFPKSTSRFSGHSTELAPFVAAEAKDGSARFRPPDQALGPNWNLFPLGTDKGYEVFLAAGAAIWLRVIPRNFSGGDWAHDELLKCGRDHRVLLQPLNWNNLQYLRAEDGIGAYQAHTMQEAETPSVAFAFNSGEIWCVDTTILQISGGRQIYFREIVRGLPPRLRGFGSFLHCLGIEPPYHWIAGLEGIQGWVLNVPPPSHTSIFPGQSCLSNVVAAHGVYGLEESEAVALMPLFNQLFRKCGMSIPAYIREAINKGGTF